MNPATLRRFCRTTGLDSSQQTHHSQLALLHSTVSQVTHNCTYNAKNQPGEIKEAIEEGLLDLEKAMEKVREFVLRGNLGMSHIGLAEIKNLSLCNIGLTSVRGRVVA